MGRSKVKDIHTLNRLIEYMMQNPAQTFSVNSISKYFESVNRKVSNDTLYSYIDAMQSAMLISKAVRYDIRGKRILTRQDKYYLMDNGLGRIKNSGFKIEYYQVAYLLASDEVVKREFGAFEAIGDNYPKYVISMDKFDFSRNGIIHKNLVEFLLE